MPSLTMWPYGDLGIALFSGDGGVKSAASTSASGTACTPAARAVDGPSEQAALRSGFLHDALRSVLAAASASARRITAYTSPNNMFTTREGAELQGLEGSHARAVRRARVRAGRRSGQADGGQFIGGSPGTYLELGVGPSWPLGDGVATLTVPVKMGLSLSDYYERLDENGVLTDDGFGFFDIGGLVTVPLTDVASNFGSWNFHAGPGLPHARRHEPGCSNEDDEHQGRRSCSASASRTDARRPQPADVRWGAVRSPSRCSGPRPDLPALPGGSPTWRSSAFGGTRGTEDAVPYWRPAPCGPLS